jgi:hypothetical protein
VRVAWVQHGHGLLEHMAVVQASSQACLQGQCECHAPEGCFDSDRVRNCCAVLHVQLSCGAVHRCVSFTWSPTAWSHPCWTSHMQQHWNRCSCMETPWSTCLSWHLQWGYAASASPTCASWQTQRTAGGCAERDGHVSSFVAWLYVAVGDARPLLPVALG